MHPNPSEILRLFSHLQDRLYHGDTVKKAITQICNYTRDTSIINTCQVIAELLERDFQIINYPKNLRENVFWRMIIIARGRESACRRQALSLKKSA